VAIGPLVEDLRWLIQSASESGRRTDLGGMGWGKLWPDEDVHGGMVLGDRRLSGDMVDKHSLRDALDEW
jgi:hypothetical protein